ncbi:hypothetical protein CONPUDRAFT_138186 [Coniophora puteana RWD-64-598 SS2]|uniref:Zn(2)-C6 fungal-type domain-containing protein n=1 Tax=Coniophora puteana (strain RWD-64-598) TaxID=741705 RepID=A0A5M3MJW1_CONPW|nr:uncharacterized protein CONPUDRAFT_138186 [Coniophora puteana RWD-64-598 SS2]EIW78881.1 hypothetical protein CONPUDRAFT_138186 [Coniophora puteana RWD-64-598 SS2]
MDADRKLPIPGHTRQHHPPSSSTDTGRPTSSHHAQQQLPSIRQLHPDLPPSGLATQLPQPTVTTYYTSPTSAYPMHVPSTDVTSGPSLPYYTRNEAPDSEPDAESEQPAKKRRRRQALSCNECKRRKIKCDRAQPCGPCTRRGEQSKCQWRTLEPVDKYVTRTEYDEMRSRHRVEHDALRARVDHLEGLIRYLPGTAVPIPSGSGPTALGGYPPDPASLAQQQQQQQEALYAAHGAPGTSTGSMLYPGSPSTSAYHGGSGDFNRPGIGHAQVQHARYPSVHSGGMGGSPRPHPSSSIATTTSSAVQMAPTPQAHAQYPPYTSSARHVRRPSVSGSTEIKSPTAARVSPLALTAITSPFHGHAHAPPPPPPPSASASAATRTSPAMHPALARPRASPSPRMSSANPLRYPVDQQPKNWRAQTLRALGERLRLPTTTTNYSLTHDTTPQGPVQPPSRQVQAHACARRSPSLRQRRQRRRRAAEDRCFRPRGLHRQWQIGPSSSSPRHRTLCPTRSLTRGPYRGAGAERPPSVGGA